MTTVVTPAAADSAAPPPAIGTDLIAALRRQLPDSAERHQARAPFDGGLLPAVPQSDPQSVADVAVSARTAQPHWAATPIAERQRIARRFARALIANEGPLCDLMQWETGKARVHAAIEVQGVVQVAAYYGRTGASHLRPRRVTGAIPGVVSARVGYRPRDSSASSHRGTTRCSWRSAT